jgi:hypothetical protein
LAGAGSASATPSGSLFAAVDDRLPTTAADGDQLRHYTPGLASDFDHAAWHG